MLEATTVCTSFDAGANAVAKLLLKYNICDGVSVINYDGKYKNTRIQQKQDTVEFNLDLTYDDLNDSVLERDPKDVIILETVSTGVRLFHIIKVLHESPWEWLVISSLSKQKISDVDHEILSHAHLQMLSVYNKTKSNSSNSQFQDLDGLTNLNIKNQFLRNFSMRIEGLSQQQDFALAILDVAGMGVLNNQYSMAFGDKALRRIADVLSSVIRGDESIGRNSGDQFSFFIVSTNARDDVLTVIERVQERFKNSLVVDGKEVTVRLHVGYVIANKEEMSAEDCFNCAELAVKQAKSLGLYKATLYEPYMLDNYFGRFHLEKALHSALENNEYVLLYQPIVNLKTQAIVSVEALIRWRKAEHAAELISPIEFIPILEQTSLIVPVGRWLVKQALQDYKLWSEQHDGLQQVCINVSAKQFCDSDLHLFIKQCLEEYRLSAKCLNIEITESVYLEANSTAESFFQGLTELGVDITLDDFGTGYSSLSYLHRYPIHRLKIDQSFISDFAANDKNDRVLQSIIALSQSLNMTAVAEGIEDDDTANTLLRMGVEFGQGFYFSPPVPADEFNALLMDSRK